MGTTESFMDALERGLANKAKNLDGTELPQLKDHFKVYQSAYQGMYSILLKKGIIHEDQYKFELKISDVTNPAEGLFGENEKIDQMSTRCSVFEAMLDFLNNYYQFSVDFLTMAKIKRLAGLVKYFNFAQFSENSQYLNTRTLAELVSGVKKGQDPLSAGIVNDSLLHLEKCNKEILRILKELTFYQKERYKLEIRKVVMAGLKFDREVAVTHKDDCIKQIRKKFSEAALSIPFYPELAEEILAEDYSNDSEAMRATTLKQLEIKEEARKKASGPDFKAILLEAVRVMSACSFQLEDAARKIEENTLILEAGKNTFFVKLAKALRSVFNIPPAELVYCIEYMDPVTAFSKSEKIDINKFMEDLAKKSKTFQQLSIRTSPAYKRLEGASETQILQFLEKNGEELQGYQKRLQALDTFFKSEVEKEDRNRIRGVQTEITTIKNTSLKVNQKRHEYVAQKEEIDQMRKLGISVD